MFTRTKVTGHEKHVAWLQHQYGYSQASAEKEATRREHFYPQEAKRWEDPTT